MPRPPARSRGIAVAICAVIVGLGAPGAIAIAHADEAHARQAVRAMSDAMAADKDLSFDFDALLDVVTTEGQKLTLASSGSVVINRPDKLKMTRKGGFADVELLFDGKKLTLFGKAANRYVQIEVPRSIDQVVDTLREEYGRPVPGGDFVLSDVAAALMEDVTDAKELGSGIVGGVECDHFAFRAGQVD